MKNETTEFTQDHPVLILGGTGKTGSRIVSKLRALGIPTRVGSRSATPSFDWDNESTWAPVLKSVKSVYINFSPDLAVPGATDSIRALVKEAAKQEVKHLVILSGRGEAEAQACERIVQESGIDWTVIRASWFNQNFSEGAFVDMVNQGVIALPAGQIAEPFVDIEDIADVAVAALTALGHTAKVYELTGPRLMTFSDIAHELSMATGREIVFHPLTHEEFVEGVKQSGAPDIVVWMMDYLFATVLDGRNSYLCNGVQEALGRQPKDFKDYASEVAASGQWRKVA